MQPLGPLTLEGKYVRLEPLRIHHADALAEAGREPEIWQRLDFTWTGLVSAERFIDIALKAEAQGKEYPFAVVLRETGQVIGSTRYMDVDEDNKTTEVGWTWYMKETWGTLVNPEAKFLLFRHAFEDWGARRVWLKTDQRNTHSQAAMKKLGAQYEGTWRNHRIRRDGSARHSVVFSVIDSEWPEVKAGLQNRIG